MIGTVLGAVGTKINSISTVNTEIRLIGLILVDVCWDYITNRYKKSIHLALDMHILRGVIMNDRYCFSRGCWY